jgi:hypothetical protein
MEDVTWAALTLSLTAVCGIYTWFAFRRRGLAAGLKGAGITVLPLAAYLTKTLQMFTRIGDAVVDWATSLVFSPTVWLGVLLAGAGVLLYGAGRFLDRRRGDPQPGKRTSKPTGDLPAGRPPRSEPIVVDDDDDDLADIEAILKKRGIT